jgi:hypothetical protein
MTLGATGYLPKQEMVPHTLTERIKSLLGS